MSSPALSHVEQAAITFPSLAENYNELGSLFQKKLYKQLTDKIWDFLSDDENNIDGNFITLWFNFVVHLERKINQLSLGKIAVRVCEFYSPDDHESSRALLDTLLTKPGLLGPAANLFISVSLGSLLLSTPNPTPHFPSVKAILATAHKTLTTTLASHEHSSNDTSCHSAFFKAQMQYYKLIGPADAFYKNCLMFLSYTNCASQANGGSLKDSERVVIARDISLAAISGEGIFNFGEVVETPVLQSLLSTPDAWLLNLMECFSKGDVNGYNKVMAASKSQFDSQPALKNKATFIHEKITLLALVDMVFTRESTERCISFEEIAARCQVDINQVEWVVMRGISLGLVKGSMDQVAGNFEVKWVLPRVLNKEQISVLSEKLGEWETKVGDMKGRVLDATVELLH